MELTREQRIRVDKHKCSFYRYMMDGTIVHCVKLYRAGMESEAVEILSDFTGKSENETIKIIKSNMED